MSHFLNYECIVNSKSALIKALEQMNLSVLQHTQITDYYRKTIDVELAVSRNGKQLPIGFQNVNGEYQLVADWFQTGFSEKEFTKTVQQFHDQFVAIEMLESQNWYIESITKTTSGELEIQASKWA